MIQANAPSKLRLSLSFLTLLLIALFVFLSIHGQNPPAPVPASAPLTEFSSGRAMKYLETISRKPHPIGSTEHDAVRDYLLAEFRAIGLNPEVQRTTVVNTRQVSPFRAATVENIVARISGAKPARAVLLIAHYDSVPTSFGASDDGAAVAALLETARALKAGPPLDNDVIFLITDGEEVGLLGARAFVNQHPWARDVGVALNFDARGNSGPVIMFQTSEGNGWLIKEFAKAAPYRVANSLSAEVYKRLPNDTDLSVLKEAGLPGLNFAHIKDISHYHTSLDNFAEVDERSLEHQGSYALQLARHFGNLKLESAKTADAVYFNAPGSIFISYSQAWVIPAAILLILVFAALVLYGFKKRELTLYGIAMGALAFLLSLIGTPLTVAGLWYLIRNSSHLYAEGPWGATYNGNLYLLGFIALTCALTCALYSLFRRRVSLENLSVGALCWWLALAVGSSFYLPGGSYLLVWPLLFTLAGIWLTFVWKTGGPVNRLGLLLLCAAPGIILLSLTIYQLFLAFGVSPLIIGVMVVLLFGLLLPIYDFLTGMSSRAFVIALTLLSIGFVVAAVTTEGFDDRHPRANNIFYGLDADTGNAFWASTDERPDEWTSQFLPAGSEQAVLPVYPLSFRPFLTGPAAAAALAAPAVSVLEDQTGNGVRTLRLRITSQRSAPVVSIYADQEALIQEGSINGQPIDFQAAPSGTDARGDLWGITYYAFPPEGAELILKLRSTQPLHLRVEDRSFGLPEIQGFSYTARPASMMPTPSPYSDATLVGKSFTF
jgi:hypothetical protein